MLLVYMLIIWRIQAVSPHQFNMYNTNHRQDGFCLLYYLDDHLIKVEKVYKLAHQIIPYCLRPSNENILAADFDFNNTIHSNFTFGELREKNISSQLLLSWSASIDLAESYQSFLDNITNSSSVESETLFYNCTSPWFGPLCRFTFDPLIDTSLNEIITYILEGKPRIRTGNKLTCYEHVNCQTSLICLDWREICDRKNDCLDGSDEFNCWQLEWNECAENEHRCHNGQCIPEEFFHDVSLNPDCLDRTDEHFGVAAYHCSDDPAFRCEEHTCRPDIDEFSCGDGECTSAGYGQICNNGRDNPVSIDLCSMAMTCIIGLVNQIGIERCQELCEKSNCINDHCPSVFEFPPGPVLFGHVRFMYNNTKREIRRSPVHLPAYVCYDEQLCANFLPVTVHLNNFTCRHFHELRLSGDIFNYNHMDLLENVKDQFRPCSTVFTDTQYCNHSSMYQCEKSTKCISKHRLVDGFQDCPLNDDETFKQNCSLINTQRPFTCTVGDNKKCYAFYIFRYGTWGCREEQVTYDDSDRLGRQRNHINFLTICDRKVDLPPMLIDDQYQTDETECEHWPCNNTYARCDGFWRCNDGADEINCSPSTCPEFEHECIFLNDTSKVSCLPMARAGDNHTDCFGGSDEPRFCQAAYPSDLGQPLRCENSAMCFFSTTFCDDIPHCPDGDDEKLCMKDGSKIDIRCGLDSDLRTELHNYLCRAFQSQFRTTIYFKLQQMPIYPLQLASNVASYSSLSKPKTQLIRTNRIINNKYSIEWWWRCNRGLPIQIQMSDGTNKLSCLCPPSYYGDQCQYQNQRVSLTLQIQAASDWRHLFTFVITLIENEKNIESHDHIEYLSVRDCDTKFNVYLLYSSQPKNSSKNYSVQIDAYNKSALNYRASWIFPLQFLFLPVHRLSVLLKLPIYDVEPLEKCTSPCIHGQCFNYINDQNSTFCRCSRGWLGPHCNITHECNCAPNSVCIGDSICVCPIGRYGPRCHLIQSSCDLHLCVNGGQCVSNDERYVSTDSKKSTCICSEQYYGERCERQQTRIDVSFHKKVTVPSSLLIHFITVQNNADPSRTSVMKNIAYDQNLVIFYTSVIFNIAFAQMSNEYYLLILREVNISSTNISTQISPSHRCLSVHDLFDETLANRDLLRRIKHYHIPCQKRLELVCFYDEVHFCLCNRLRHANCFKFNHSLTYDCNKYNLCENGGQCFRDDPTCPTSSTCVCRDCSYGSKCQFSTRGSTLSLDTILGYQIRPSTGVNRQPAVIKVAIAFVTTILVLGLINSLFCFLTFQMKKTRDFGCGLYLFASSITSTIIVSVLTIKFWLLLAAHMGSLKNRSFIHGQCVFIDFLLRLLLSTSDWLSACVAMERAANISKGVNFNKTKSKKVAKWMILFIVLFTSVTHIHDPIHRHLINDEEEQRTWCITKYSSSLEIFDWIVNIFHFSVPFSINCISAVMIMIIAARNRSNAQKKESYKKILREQFHHHKHLLISPMVLVLLALPRLIISFLFGCMKSARNPWLYLIGYFFSFIPPTLIFVVFVLPSELYKREFYNSIRRFWRI